MSMSREDNIAVSVRNVSKSFGASMVLDDIGFDVDEGEIVVLLGASGSGKTTILRIVAGLESPDSGSVVLHGTDVTNVPARLRGTGVIFQSYALFPKMNVEQNIAYGLKLRRRSAAEIKETIDRLVDMVHLEDHRTKYPSQLSGGQQQRVAIARALAYEPQVLLFDEPFGALDAQIRTMLRREIRSLLKKIRVPSIFITLDSLPLTPTGKVDRRSLPPPQGTRPALENPYVAPGSPLEETLVKIWADVLHLEQVGVHDHFLELGGDSLLATMLVSRVLNALHVQVPLRSLFKVPTVAQMARVILEILANKVGEEKLHQMFGEALSQDDLPSSPSAESSLEKA